MLLNYREQLGLNEVTLYPVPAFLSFTCKAIEEPPILPSIFEYMFLCSICMQTTPQRSLPDTYTPA